MARNTIKPTDLGAAIAEQLGLYHEEVVEAVNAAGEKAVKKLVQITKKTAPVRTGKYYKAITSETVPRPAGNIYVWGVEKPHHRVTHLLVKGHPTRNGGRTTGDPFLQNALDTVLPEYEKDIQEALKND